MADVKIKAKHALAACPECRVERNSEDGTPECFHCPTCNYSECSDPRLHTPEGEVL
jgi:hypothetical protein